MLAALAVSFGVSTAQNILAGQQQREATKAQNQATKAQNRINAVEAVRAIQGTRMQAAAVREQAAKDLSTAQRMANMATGQATAQAAAAGVRGATVDAVADDIAIELDRAQAEVQDSAIMQEFNLNERIRSIAAQTRMNLGRLTKVPSYGNILASAVAGGAMSAGSQYAQQYFKFGASAVESGRNLQGQSTALTNNSAFVSNM
jgi:hypothetical protein